MLDFTIFKQGTDEERRRNTMRLNPDYRIESDVGSVTAFALYAHDPALPAYMPVWGIADVKYSRLGEKLRSYYYQRDFFLYERGGSEEGYLRFYSQYGRSNEESRAIFEADRDAYERSAQALAEHGYGPGGEPFGYNRSHVR